MKSIKQHIFEKLKVSSKNEYNGEFIGEFEALTKNILDISKSRLKNKNDYKKFISDLQTYFKTYCEDESIKYSTKNEVNSSNYNKNNLYFHQYYTTNEFILHYNNLTYYFKYDRSKLKMEKIIEDTYYRECTYIFGGFTSILYEFPEDMIDIFNKNIGNF